MINETILYYTIFCTVLGLGIFYVFWRYLLIIPYSFSDLSNITTIGGTTIDFSNITTGDSQTFRFTSNITGANWALDSNI